MTYQNIVLPSRNEESYFTWAREHGIERFEYHESLNGVILEGQGVSFPVYRVSDHHLYNGKVNLEAIVSFYSQEIDRAAELGADILRMISSIQLLFRTDREISEAALRQISQMAEARNIKVAFEPELGDIFNLEAFYEILTGIKTTSVGVSLNFSKMIYKKTEANLQQVKEFDYDRTLNGTANFMEKDGVLYPYGIARILKNFILCFCIENYTAYNGELHKAPIEMGDIYTSCICGLITQFILPANPYIILEDPRLEEAPDFTSQQKDRELLKQFDIYNRCFTKRHTHHIDEKTKTDAIKARFELEECFGIAEYVSNVLRITLDNGSIGEGGCIRLQMEVMYRGGYLQNVFPERDNYVSVKCGQEDVELGVYTYFSKFVTLDIEVLKGKLRKGVEISITLGERSKGSRGYYTGPVYANIRYHFWVKYQKSEDFYEVEDIPLLKLATMRAERMRLVSPSIIEAGEKFSVLVTLEDKSGYQITSESIVPYKGKVSIEDNCNTGTQRELFIDQSVSSVLRLQAFSISREGLYHISGRDDENGLKTISNPVICKKNPQYKLYWGDVHCHSTISDGLFPLEWMIRYARDCAGLDFMAPGDHHWSAGEEGWNITRELVEKYNVPGEFVTILGLETDGGRITGHRNIYFRDGEAPRFEYDGVPECYEEMWRYLENRKALVIPHQPMIYHPNQFIKGRNVEFNLNYQYERLVEVASCHHGNEYMGCENSFPQMDGLYCREILDKGFKVGFTGSSDTHDSHCGYAPYEKWRHSPITAVYAKEKTRESIWDALYDRRCYATTGARILLDFRLNGYMMGEELSLKAGEERKLYIFAVGEDYIESVTVVKNGQEIYKMEPETPEVELEFRDETPCTQKDYYYIRIKHKNGEYAWASPIFIEICQ